MSPKCSQRVYTMRPSGSSSGSKSSLWLKLMRSRLLPSQSHVYRCSAGEWLYSSISLSRELVNMIRPSGR